MAPTPDSNSDLPTPPEISSKFKEIIKANGITDKVSKVTLKGSGLLGENFGGVLEYITVEFENDAREPLELFVKRKPDNTQCSKMLDEFQAYSKESAFLTEYLPKAMEYCTALGQQDLMNFYPKCYYGDEKMIVLENLVVGRGFVLLSKEEKQDFETASLALTNLAKHHAISYAVIEKLGRVKSFLEQFPKLDFEAFGGEAAHAVLSPTFENTIGTQVTILERCGLDGSSKAAAILKSFQGRAWKSALECLKTTPEDTLVLNHGDYWNNNMLFRKDTGSDKLVEQVPVDYQIVRMTSPTLDITQFLFTSVKAEVRRGRFRDLLQIYWNTLKKVGNDLGHPIHLSLEKLEAEFCRHFRLGFIFGLVFSTGVALEAVSDMDMREANDFGAMMSKKDAFIAKWVEDNPEKTKEEAASLIEHVKEYERSPKQLPQ